MKFARITIILILVVPTLFIACGKRSNGVDSVSKTTKVEITDIDSYKFVMELLDIVPSHLGTAVISLTKSPSGKLENIIWEGIPIRPYQDQTKTVREIQITGEPVSFQYEGYATTFYFYPIKLLSTSGKSEEYYWQGEHLSGFRTTESGITTRVSISISQIENILFLHE